MSDRVDDLLDIYLETGEFPDNASATERAEVERLAAAAGMLHSSRRATGAEARETMPTARARFERFVQANQPQHTPARAGVAPPKPGSNPRRSFFAPLLAMNRMAGAGVTAAVVALVAIVALFASQNAADRTESAAALVLEPGDYAQVQGVVSQVADENGIQVVTLASEFGDLRVALSDTTSVIETGGLGDASSVTPGQALLIAGLVGADRSIAAQTLSLVTSAQEPGLVTLEDLRRRPPLEFSGTLTFVSIRADGDSGRVVIATPDGRYNVRVDQRSAAALFTSSPRLIGAAVHASRSRGDDVGTWVVTLAQQQPSAAATTTPGFVTVTGTLIARDGNLLTVQTNRGPATVAIRTDTTLVVAGSGITRADFIRGETAIGHTVTVQGGIQRVTGRIIADLVVVGPKP